jgi:hypothetical protein
MTMNMNLRPALSQKMSAWMGRRQALLLEATEPQFARIVHDLETDPLFRKLAFAHSLENRAIRLHRPWRASFSPAFLELKDDLLAGRGDAAPDVESWVAENRGIVLLIRQIPPDLFRECFLEGKPLPAADIAARCGLDLSCTVAVMEFVNLLAMSEPATTDATTPGDGPASCRVIASVIREGAAFEIRFASPHWSRGLYEIDYTKISALRRQGLLTDEENVRLRALIQSLEILNQRKSSLFRVLEGILSTQRAWFEAEGKSGFRPQRQKDLASVLGIHASLVSRALAGRSLRAPWGEEIPLKDFFPMEKRHATLPDRLRRILREKGKPLGDRQIALRLTREYGEPVAPRTVARYRNALGFPNAYGRRPSDINVVRPS